MQVGLVGLGRMDFDMRQRMHGAGHQVIGYEHRPEVSDAPGTEHPGQRHHR